MSKSIATKTSWAMDSDDQERRSLARLQIAVIQDEILSFALSIIYLRMNKRAEALAEMDLELAIAPESAIARQVRQAMSGVKL